MKVYKVPHRSGFRRSDNPFKEIKRYSDVVILGIKQKTLKTNKQNAIHYLMGRKVGKFGTLRQQSKAY